MIIILIILIIISVYIYFKDNFKIPVFVSSRGFTQKYRPHDFYDSLTADNVYDAK